MNNNIQVLYVTNGKSNRLNENIKKSIKKYFDFELLPVKLEDLYAFISKKVHLIIFEDISVQNVSYAILESIQSTNKNLFTAMITKKYSEKHAVKIYDSHIDYIFDSNFEDKYFIAKLKAIFKRQSSKYQHNSELVYKNIVIDQLQREVRVSEKFIETTNKEYKLLKELVRNQGKFMTKTELFQKIWGYEEDTTRILSQYLHRIKNKIGSDVKIVKLREEGIALI